MSPQPTNVGDCAKGLHAVSQLHITAGPRVSILGNVLAWRRHGL